MTGAPPTFLFLLASTRTHGNSERLARRAALALPESVPMRWIRLADLPLPPFEDTRHSGGYGDPEGTAAELARATLDATDLVVVTPVYWYSLPAEAKRYLDHWSAWMRAPSLAFRERMRGRRLWVVASDSDREDEGSADPLLDSLRRTAAFMDMTFAGVLVGHGSRPGEALEDPAVLAAADALFAPVCRPHADAGPLSSGA